jgi:DeoR family transcriptional regulator, glycerol-3-phosphate regulon repressor
MEKAAKQQNKRKRQDAIVAELRASPAIRIVELAVEHDVSTETIRRDLDEMSAAGLVSRTYGGAVSAALPQEPLFDERFRANAAQHMALSKAVVPLINNGDTLMVDAGSTTISVAKRLASERNGLTVITTSFGVASAFASNSTIRVRMCPGEFDSGEGGVRGPDTLGYLERFHVSHAIIGASRLDGDGPSDFNSASVWIKRAMIRQAAATILVVDSNKFEQKALEHICSLDKIRCLATDIMPPPDLEKALKRHGVRICL